MIDLHCHILSGIDDGTKNMDDSIEIARETVAENIAYILAMPHYKNGHWTMKKRYFNSDK